MQDFTFHRPGSIEDAVRTLREKPDGKALGGGQSLIPVMKLGLAAPSDLVSVAALAELRGLKLDGRELVVGAATSHAEVADSPDVNKAIPALADLAGHIGDPQVRNRGTLGGSLAHDDPAADYPAAVLALGATVVTDRRRIPADDFFVGMFQTALQGTSSSPRSASRSRRRPRTRSSRTPPPGSRSAACSWRGGRAASASR
jgi:aerobic carbon-monoxide dehydrogenase medium subunit